MALPGQHAPNLNRGSLIARTPAAACPVSCSKAWKEGTEGYASQSTEVPGLVYSLGEALFGT